MRPRPSVIGALAVALCLMTSGVCAQAQETATVDELVRKLQSSKNTEVEQAREALIERALQGDTLVARQIARALGEAKSLESPSTLVRLNTVLVASALPDGEGVELLLAGLSDETAAVRYIAAKAIEKLSARNDRPAVDWNTITATLAARVPAENSDYVQRRILTALVNIDSGESRMAAIDLLIKRAALHAKEATLPQVVEVDAFTRLLKDAFKKDQNGIKLPRAYLGKMAVAGLRFMQVASSHLAGSGLDEAGQASHKRMFETGQAVFHWVIGKLVPGQTIPPKIDGEDWPRNRDKVRELIQMMSQPPFNLPADSFPAPAV